MGLLLGNTRVSKRVQRQTPGTDDHTSNPPEHQQNQSTTLGERPGSLGLPWGPKENSTPAPI